MTHLDQVLQPILGYALATLSTGAIWIANAIPEPSPWLQLGGTAGLVGGLSYGCCTLWKSLQQQREEFTRERAAFIEAKDALEKEIRDDWKDQNDKLIAVLQRLDEAQ